MSCNRKCKLNNRGAAMVLTIVLILVVLIFAFSLILVSYSLYSSQTKNLSSARNSEAVNTFSAALSSELTDSNAYNKSNLWKYLRCNIANMDSNGNFPDWPYYAEDEDGYEIPTHPKEYAVRYFTVNQNESIEGLPAVMRVGIYWMLPEDINEADFLRDIASDDLDTRLGALNGIRIVIETTAETGSQVYRVEDTYRLSVAEAAETEYVREVEMLAGNSINNPANHSIDAREKWILSLVERR